jgi:uncharacterized protein
MADGRGVMALGTAVRGGTMSDMILWRRLDLPGHELGRINRRDDGWELSGTAVFSHAHRPCKLDYLVLCASDWQTRAARISGVIGNREIALRVSVDRERTWYLEDVECPAVAGCMDIDLGFSPATNLLPIRRLSLAIGQGAQVSAAWLPFPSLTLEPLPQVYRREGQHTYRYESGGGAFMRLLEVNEVGFVTNYPDLWVQE